MDNEDIQASQQLIVGKTVFMGLKDITGEYCQEEGKQDQNYSDFKITATAVSTLLESHKILQNPTRCILKNEKKLRVVIKRLKFRKNGDAVLPRRLNNIQKRVFKPCVVQLHKLVLNRREHLKIIGRLCSSLKNQSLADKITFGQTKKGKPQLLCEGFAYNRCSTSANGKTYWRCVHYKCKAWIKQHGDIYIPTGNHTKCTPYELKKPKVFNRKLHRCQFCDRIFNKKSNWVVHQRTHTGEKPFSCPFCDKRFASVGILISHKRWHTNDKPYKCGECDYKSATGTNLKNHKLRWHTINPLKRFTCEVCQKSFLLKSTLNFHVKTHTGEKRYQCHICKRRFTKSHALNGHKKAHSDKKQFKRKDCPYTTKYNSSSKRHAKAKHSDIQAFKSTSLYYSKISDAQFKGCLRKLRTKFKD